MKIFIAGIGILVAGSLVVAVIFVVLARHPRALFPYSVRMHRLVLNSDEPLNEIGSDRVLTLVEAKLTKSPLERGSYDHEIFICNAGWRQRLFFGFSFGVGGVAHPFTHSVFFRSALLDENRLISPHGRPVPGDRTLDYFIVHEITHDLTRAAVGTRRYLLLPKWVREGYADYVGKGGTFRYDEEVEEFLTGDPKMDPEKSGLYSRHQLLVTYLPDRQHWSVERLLKESPSQETVERKIADSVSQVGGFGAQRAT